MVRPKARSGRRRRSRPQEGHGRGGSSRERAGADAFWSGTLTFGLVGVPVDLFPATRSQRPRLRMLTDDGVPLRRRFFCPHDERLVETRNLVRGYEDEDGGHVVVLDEELEALDPRKSREIDLRSFVPVQDIDPHYFERGYFLAPAGETSKPYRLLAQVMERSGRAGIATFVMRGKEYLVAIFSEGGILRAQTLRFHDELRSAQEVGLPDPPDPHGAPTARVQAFEAAIEALLADELDQQDLVDRAALALERRVRQKERSGTDVVESPALEVDEEWEAEEESDPMAQIKRSLGAWRTKDGGGRSKRRRPARQRRPAGRADLTRLTKAQLYERAAEQDIPGRSQMTKDELLAALRPR